MDDDGRRWAMTVDNGRRWAMMDDDTRQKREELWFDDWDPESTLPRDCPEGACFDSPGFAAPRLPWVGVPPRGRIPVGARFLWGGNPPWV
jgi:hypothetical protein